MRKGLLLIACLIVLAASLFFPLPHSNAQRPSREQSARRKPKPAARVKAQKPKSAVEQGTTRRPKRAARAQKTAPVPPVKALYTNAEQNAEAFAAAPGLPFDSAQLPEVTGAPSLRAEAEKESSVLSDIDPATLKRLKEQPFVARRMPQSYTSQQDGATANAAPTSVEPQPLAPTPVRSFPGVGSDDQINSGTPPDTDMAAGPNHVVTVVNRMFAVYDKNGTRVQLNTLAALFNNVCAGCSPFDPRVIYDPLANRWLIVALELDDDTRVNKILLRVSQNSDPTGLWWNYSLEGVLNFNGEDTWGDYPDLSFDGITAEAGGAIYITANQFTFDSRTFRTATLYILPKSALYAGSSFNYWRTFDRRNADGSPVFTFRGAKTYGNPGGEYFINTRFNSSAVSLWRVVPTYPPAAINMTLQATVEIGPYSPPPPAKQPSCADRLDTGDNRMYNAVWRNNRLYAAFTEAHDWGGGGGTVATVRFLKINTSSNAVELNQAYGADGLDYFYPAIATDNADNIVLVFARSGSSEYGSIRYTGRTTTDATTQPSASLKDGVQCLTGDAAAGKAARYGDYQGAAIDPADGSKVWIYGEWAANTTVFDTGYDWGTWIGQVQFGGASCTYSISPSGNSVGAGNSNGSVTVTSSAGCTWTAASNASWLTITSGSSGSGNGTVNYSVAANPTNAARTGTLTVAGQTFTVTQAAGTCTTSAPINFGSPVNASLSTTDCRATNRSGSYADRYTFSGTAGQQVAISMSASFDTFLYLLAPNGTITAFDDDGGGGTNSRIPSGTGFLALPTTGTYTIEATSFSSDIVGNYTLSVTTACTYSISPTSRNFAAAGGSNSVSVTAPTGCTWSATSNASWITISAGASGAGNGAVSYSVAANPNTSPRTGTMSIAGQTFTVTQDAAACTYSITPTAQSFNASAGAGSIFVTAGAGCVWTATSNSGFITITSGSSGTGSGTVNYSVAANTTTSARTGTLGVAGQTFTVTQAANTISTVQLVAASVGANEADRKVSINVTRTGSTSAIASVDYATTDSTTDNRKDYSQTLGTLTFGVGESVKAVTVFITDDVFQESPETFNFTLSNAVGITLGMPSTTVVTINSNDAATGLSPVGAAAFNSDFFVRQHYVDFLNREADASGLSFWKGQLDECETLPEAQRAYCRDIRRQNVSAAFFLSPEFQDTGFYVVRMQRVAFGKRSDTAQPSVNARLLYSDFIRDARQVGDGFIDGAAGAQQKLEANKQAYAEQIVASAPFASRFPQATAAAYVDGLYLSAGVVPTPVERQEAMTAFGAGGVGGRTAALRKVAESGSIRSAEFRQAFVLMEYFGYMRRDPDQAGYDFWLGKLNNHLGNYISAEMVRSFLVSGEYMGRFGQP